MNVLVTGGAGYIGSFVSHRLIERGHHVIVYDNFSTGRKEFLHPKCKFVLGDVRDRELPARVMKDNKVDIVMHFAAKTSVTEANTQPLDYFENNTFGTMNILQNMVKSGVKKFIFSSTAAVYGDTRKDFVDEMDILSPINPYGESKASSEKMIHYVAEIHGLSSVILRYFNVAGASLDNQLGQKNPVANHLFHFLTETALGRQKNLHIYGNDYPTVDGTGVRDFIHVEDIAHAHILAAEKLMVEDHYRHVFNCGYGHGYSVLEALHMMENVAGRSIPYEIIPRRPGDPAKVLARSEKIKKELNWHPQFDDLEIICKTALDWKAKTTSS
ncbi:MAG: UDP-glucose 4-epimerase GalE [Bdellovibrionaceae bacterium]|nr:UDP-glucose 4-epimerase GalE [Pseudobdellovibrionaceae bacterium]